MECWGGCRHTNFLPKPYRCQYLHTRLISVEINWDIQTFRGGEKGRNLETHATSPCTWALPWVCLGDFNEILSLDEKNGGIPRQVTPMLSFRHTLLQCGLVDLGFKGYRFTWRNGRLMVAFVEERLDRCVATMEWRDRFSRAMVHYLAVPYFDHDPVLLDMAPSNYLQRRRRWIKRFEEKWVTHLDCENVI